MLKTQAIKTFLSTASATHLTSMYNENMEVQVNVAKDEGTCISEVYKGKRWRGWKGADGSVWKSFRIPWNADSEPQYEDRDLTFDLATHVEAIGMTGWNWFDRTSLWVGFDFDSITNHKNGLSKEELTELVNKVSVIPWITLLKSTSGHGYHIYIHFDKPYTTNTHTEHAAVARSLLSVLTIETGFDFQAAVDCCGGVLWCYHRKQEGTDGLTLLKSGSSFGTERIPSNWKDHISVTSKKHKRVPLAKRQDSNIDELIASQQVVTLDEDHYKLLKWFSVSATRDYWWDSDHSMLVCHTLDLAKAHAELKLRGIFYTSSSGSTTQNCFCFPSLLGVWVVRRHGIGTKEHPSWLTDSSGWTRCVYNSAAELESAVKTNRGVKNSKGAYIFDKHTEGLEALRQMNIKLDVPDIFNYEISRSMSITPKGDMLILSVDKVPNEKRPDGWLASNKDDKWEMVLDMPRTKKELTAPDNLIRHSVSQGIEAGWYVRAKSEWVFENKSNVTSVLVSQEDFDRQSIEVLIGKSIISPWEMVNIPFGEEYPGNRQWNKDAASFRVTPEAGDCSTWLSVVRHCSSYLNDAVVNDPWCQTNGIKDGSDYLLCWISSMLQKPTQPLPYLFFVGDQNTGKSTLHEALGQFIIKKGYVRADQALVNPSGFNGEVANAVLCVVEETDLRVNKEAANRLKDWVTGRTISIRALYKNAYDIANSTHWIQCANDSNYCPVISGDTRIMVVRVPRIAVEIPKEILFRRLETEAAMFLDLLLNIELPESNSRLAVPCINTHEKSELEFSSKNQLEAFVHECTRLVKGHKVSLEDFYSKFLEYITPEERGYWSIIKVARDLPKTGSICKGKSGSQNITYIGNLTFDSEAVDMDFYFRQNSHNGRLENVSSN